jgi:Zn finger protein HypA/HybF involved in hydrogenase expression
MKNTEKVISDRIKNIEGGSISVINYISSEIIECRCNNCGHKITDNYRNLSYKNFKCRYCDLISKSKLIQNGDVKIENL